MSSNTSERAMVNLSLKWIPKAAELCLAEFGCNRFIGLSRTLRVCGKECCFSSLSEQSEKVQRVLQTPVEESDNKLLPLLTLYYPTNAATLQTPSTVSIENLQHYLSLFNSPLLAPSATLIRSKKHPRSKVKFSSIFFKPEGCFLALKNFSVSASNSSVRRSQ